MVFHVILVEWVASPIFLYFEQFFHICVQVCLDAVEIALRKRGQVTKTNKTVSNIASHLGDLSLTVCIILLQIQVNFQLGTLDNIV